MGVKPKKPLTVGEAILKMADLCSRSEQSPGEIDRKLAAKGMPAAERASVIEELKQRDFINEERYARSFTNDKVRFSSWGLRKIRAHLVARRIPSQYISEAFRQVDKREYLDAALRVARQKARSLNLDEYEDKVRLMRHILSRGFEPDIMKSVVRAVIAENKAEE
ncbi:MAG: recombination regulator RecX [Candidatus Amulumruptor caecigallinarius]|nr:recombination regulator RecX [Candidatus Amulumruptor caecigallinarius]